MNFRKLAITEVSSLAIGGVVAVVMALQHFGVYSLVALQLVKTAAFTVLLWVFSAWRPHRLWDWSAVRELLRFSGSLLGTNILQYWVRSADNLLVGKVAGSDALGLYTRAYSTMLLPVRQIGNVLTRVMFPALARIQDDPARVKRVYLKMVQTIALFTFPAMLGLLAVAPDFVVGVYGQKWRGAIPLLQVLCVVGMLQSVGTTVGWIYTSQGRTDVQLAWSIGASLLTFLAFGIGIFWGAMGVAVAYAVRVASTLYWNFSIPGRLIGLRFSEVLVHVLPQLIMAVGMGLLVFGLSSSLPVGWHSLVRLAVLVPSGAAVYSALLFGFRPRAYRDFVQLLGEQLKGWTCAKSIAR